MQQPTIDTENVESKGGSGPGIALFSAMVFFVVAAGHSYSTSIVRYSPSFLIGTALSPWIWAWIFWGVTRLTRRGREKSRDRGAFIMTAAAIFYALGGVSQLAQSINKSSPSYVVKQANTECLERYTAFIGADIQRDDIESFCACVSGSWGDAFSSEETKKNYLDDPSGPWVTDTANEFQIQCGVVPLGLRATIQNVRGALPVVVEEGVALSNVTANDSTLFITYRLDGDIVQLPNREPFTFFWEDNVTSKLCSEPTFRSILKFGASIIVSTVDLEDTEFLKIQISENDCASSE